MQHQLNQTKQELEKQKQSLLEALTENKYLKEKNEYLENKIKSIISEKISEYRIKPNNN